MLQWDTCLMGTCVCEVEGQVLAPRDLDEPRGKLKGSQVSLEFGRENFHFQAVYLAAQEEERQK